MHKFIVITSLFFSPVIIASEMPLRWDHSPFYDSMPKTLQQKYDKKLHHSCIFLCSIYENDLEAVEWMLKYDKGYEINKPVLFSQKGKSFYDNLSDRCFYYSLCVRELNPITILTPYDVAHYKNNISILTVLNTELGSNFENCLRNTPDWIPFSLMMKACSKPISYDNNDKQNIKSIIAHSYYSTPENENERKRNSRLVQLLALTAFINHDKQLKNILKQNGFRYDSCASPVLDFAGTGAGHSLFVTDQEITFLFNHSWVVHNKQTYIDTIEKEKKTYYTNPLFYIQSDSIPHFDRLLTILKKNECLPQKIKKSKSTSKKQEPLTFEGIMRSFLFVVLLFFFCRSCR